MAPNTIASPLAHTQLRIYLDAQEDLDQQERDLLMELLLELEPKLRIRLDGLYLEERDDDLEISDVIDPVELSGFLRTDERRQEFGEDDYLLSCATILRDAGDHFIELLRQEMHD